MKGGNVPKWFGRECLLQLFVYGNSLEWCQVLNVLKFGQRKTWKLIFVDHFLVVTTFLEKDLILLQSQFVSLLIFFVADISMTISGMRRGLDCQWSICWVRLQCVLQATIDEAMCDMRHRRCPLRGHCCKTSSISTFYWPLETSSVAGKQSLAPYRWNQG